MKNFLIAFLVFLVWAFFALWLYSWVQPKATASSVGNKEVVETNPISEEEEVVDETDSTEVIPADTFQLDGLKALNLEGDIIFLYPETISIKKNSAELDIPKSLLDYKYKLNTYALQHPDQELHVLSKYSASEQIENPNYGIQRGNIIKNELIETGIPHARIVVRSIISDISFSERDMARNGISFSFRPLDSVRYNKAQQQYYGASLTIYPRFSMSGVLENADLKKFGEDAKIILENHPELQLKIIGHTDNVGNAVDNYQSGLKDAREVRWYLVNKAQIDRKKIVALSEGESNPLTTNKTEEGRIQNRRIEAVFEVTNE
ncbi:OmpA family protein [Altibacter sp. HG106]|uniref:OmpA family protein n=1 Tax=Altibacter sp. HG106 TaxID=3023937 RepID=UPI002350C0CC|nr:OmpA family protein [Altibacter sp. HG106]MDC7993595.1 OmpA family protein [Altibacter sp. HG106]